MASHFTIPPALLEGVTALCTLSEGDQRDLAAKLTATGPNISPDSVRGQAVSVIGERATKVVPLLFSLAGLQRQAGLTPDQIFETVAENLNRYATSGDVPSELVDKWREAKSGVLELLSLRNVAFVSKALDLSFEHEHILRRARIVTDLRPVFTDEGTEIYGVLIAQTLRIHFQDAGEQKTISLALDDGDLDELHKSCERAKQKAAAAKQWSSKGGLPAHVVGQRGD